MANCGIPRIDDLLGGAAPVKSLAPGDPDAMAVGVLQDFLICHGYKGMPGPLSSARGNFGSQTEQHVKEFQQVCGLPATGTVDQMTLQALVARPAPTPVAAQGYIALVLDVQFKGMTRLMSLTSQFEGAGRFAAINPNTDRAGLSFGLIQWAQKPLRLNELLRAFQSAEPQAFVRIFTDGDPGRAEKLILHTAKARGGTNESGATTDPQFDLVSASWLARFRAAAADRSLQKVQIAVAVAAFESSLAQMRKYAPKLASEREIAFMLDLANQHGDAGARSIHQSAGDKLADLEKESVKRVAAQFGAASPEAASTQARRTGFRTSALLRDAPFQG